MRFTTMTWCKIPQGDNSEVDDGHVFGFQMIDTFFFFFSFLPLENFILLVAGKPALEIRVLEGRPGGSVG